MRTQHLFFLFLGLIFLVSCTSPPANINGHWHFDKDDQRRPSWYSTLDLSDTTGYLNKIWGYGIPDLQILSKKKTIRYFGWHDDATFNYDLRSDTLFLIDSVTNIIYKAYPADSCQLWRDLAFDNPIIPVLPIFEIGEGEWLQQRSLTNTIYIGYDKHIEVDLSNPILSNGYDLITIADIPERIAKHKLKVPEPLRPRIVMNVYADHQTPISLINEVVITAKDNGIQKSYISYRASAHARSEVYQMRIDTMDLSGYERVGDLDPKLYNTTITSSEVNNIKEKTIANNISDQSQLIVTQSMLEGIWTGDIDGNADFSIHGDSIFYLEQGSAPYTLEGDMQHIDIDGIIFSLKILRADSMLVVG